MLSTSGSIPDFPDNLPFAPISIISYQKLLNEDDREAVRVLEAAKTRGFFYLDLQSAPEGETLLTESEQLHALARDVFATTLEDILQCALERGVSLFGYKPAGTVKTTDKDLRPDTTEFINISKDHLHGVTPSRQYSPQIEQQKPLLQSFTEHGHACGMAVLRALATQLGLRPDEFTRLNRFDKHSGDHCRLTHKASHISDARAIGLPSHTDFGSVTILFNWQGGLQIEAPAGDDRSVPAWEWVKPLPGNTIVNLGDAMVIFTNGVLKSAKHRVVPAPVGRQKTTADRYSVVYFVRPHNDVPMTPLGKFGGGQHDNPAVQLNVAGKVSAGRNQAEVMTAGEWMLRRAIQLGN